MARAAERSVPCEARRRPAPVVEKEEARAAARRRARASRASSATKEQRELDELPGRIETLEAEQKALNELLADPSGYVKDAQRMTEAHQRVAEIDELLMGALERWEELGSRWGSVQNQPSRTASGCERLTISPLCRYSALSSRVARSRSMPGQSASSFSVALARARWMAGVSAPVAGRASISSPGATRHPPGR